jgi:hypothetical protein
MGEPSAAQFGLTETKRTATVDHSKSEATSMGADGLNQAVLL